MWKTDTCYPEPPLRKDCPGCGKYDQWRASTAESHSTQSSCCVWCLSEIRSNCLAVSVQGGTGTGRRYLNHPLPTILTPGHLQVDGGFADPAGQFDFLYPILLPPSSFHRCLSLINTLHPKFSLSVCFWTTQSTAEGARG